MVCEDCGGEIRIGDFPFCRGDAAKHQPMDSFGVVGDDIPGGLEMKHVLTNPDGTPKKFYSKKAIAKEMAAKGYHNHVEHKATPGSDKNMFGHTQRFV